MWTREARPEKLPGARPAKLPLQQQPWCSRHHVVASRCNGNVQKNMRLYFDASPQIIVRAGKYRELPVHLPRESEDPDGHQIRVRKRLKQFPTQLQGPGSKAKNGPGLRSLLLPGFGQQSKNSHSYSFPSWSSGANRQTQNHLRYSARQDAATTQDIAGTSEAYPDPDLSFEDARQSGLPCSETMNGSELDMKKRCSIRRMSRKFGLKHGTTVDLIRECLEEDHSALSASLTAALPEDKAEILKNFEEWCVSKFGNMVALWRKLDKDGNMSLSKSEFLTGLKALSYNNYNSALWALLDRDTTGNVTITEFVPQAAMELALFKHWADTKFGSVQKAFIGLDADHNGKMTLREFIRGCHEHELPIELKNSIPTLFHLLDDNRSSGRSVISAEEMAFLDNWKCPEYLWTHPDDEASEDFREALVSRHGLNYIIAWRKALDHHSSMRVPYLEFVQCCKRLAKHGFSEAAPACGLAAIYVGYDRKKRGWLSLRDWHEPSWTLLVTFQQWLFEQFSKVAECHRAWDKDANGITLGEFRRHVRNLDMPDEHKEYLFEGLSLEGEFWSETKGRYAHGKISKTDMVFLDTWCPEEEGREMKRWDDIFGAQSAGPETAGCT